MAKIKLVLELLQLLVAAYKFITGAISEAKFNRIVKSRKNNFDKFIKSDRKTRLQILKDENDD